MTGVIQHVIITRFNVRFSADSEVKSLGVDVKWLEDRFILFEKYCIPSINGQTNQRFTWLLLFDRDTPQRFLDQARDLISVRRGSKIVLGTTFPLDEVIDIVGAELTDECLWLVTTRLDNDDALHRDFVDNIQRSASINNTEVLNFPKGIIIRGKNVYDRRDDSNAFISLSESRAKCQTVLSIRNHKYASDSYPVRQLNYPPMWLQVVHDANISNRVRGLRIASSLARANFPALLEDDFAAGKRETAELAFENIVLFPIRTIRDVAAVLIRRTGKLFGLELQRKVRVQKHPLN